VSLGEISCFLISALRRVTSLGGLELSCFERPANPHLRGEMWGTRLCPFKARSYRMKDIRITTGRRITAAAVIMVTDFVAGA
jgi:hypothetical protein